MSVPHIKLGGQGPLLHFSHANGYPPLAYRALLEPFLDSHEVIASLHRPLWEDSAHPSTLASWQPFGDDLLELVSNYDQPIVSIGHSMGASAIVMAASQRPELFKKIVIIEPVLMPQHYYFFLKYFARLVKHNVPLIARTLERVDRWSSKQHAFDHFRPKTVFKHISDEVLWDYVEHGVIETGDGSVRLLYSREWEAQCYLLAFNLWQLLPKLSVPVLAIRGSNSNTVSHDAWTKWRNMSPQHEYLELEDAGHLLPFEQPAALAEKIRSWLDSETIAA